MPKSVHEVQHNEVGTFIQEMAFEDMGIVAPYDDNISNFLCIKEGKWDVGNHHFDCDHIYDTDMENEVEIDSPFLQDITHSDMPIRTIEREDHFFPTHEEGLLEITDPIYDTNDAIDKGLLQDPSIIAA